MTPNNLEKKVRFGEWLYGESEFNRLVANGDAMVRDGVRWLKCDRMGQDVWLREIEQ